MEPKAISRNRGRIHGESLASTLVGIAVSGIVLAVVASMYATSMRSFGGFANQFSLDSQSRTALNRISKELRHVNQITTVSAGDVTFLAGTNQVRVFHDADQRKVFRDSNGTAEELLSDCDFMQLDMLRRVDNSGTGYQLRPTKQVGQCRVIQMTWQCSRPGLGGTNTVYSQTAQIVLRN